MRITSFRLRKRMRVWLRFYRARRGSVAITFALSLIPMLALVGAAVDFSRANALKAAMQMALDSTVLMMSKTAPTQSNDQMQASAQTYFLSLFNHPEAKNVKISATYSTTDSSQVAINGSADMDTDFIGILGIKSLNINVMSTAKWGSARLRVALVLDNTGSMLSDSKIGALKTATKNLISQLQNAARSPDDVYVSIIPFVKDVKVDPSGYSASWDDWIYWDNAAKTDQKSWDANNGTCTKSGYATRSSCIAQFVCSISGNTSQSSCTAAGTCSVAGNNTQSACQNAGTCSVAGNTSQSTCTNAGTCSIAGNTSQSSCTNAGTCSNPGQTSQSNCTNNKACSNPLYTSQGNCTSHSGTWAKGTWTAGRWTAGVWTATPGTWTPGTWDHATWTPDSHTTWTGCFTDRGTTASPHTIPDYDQDVRAPVPTIAASLFPAEEYSACPQAMMGLSNNWAAMNAVVDNMTANGSTNQPIGLVWGWQTLVGGGPFTAPPKASGYEYTDAIILLSDGLNTQNRWDGNGSATSTAVDARMFDSSGNGTCANINAANITLYTIQVNTGGDPTSTLLQRCAGSPGRFPDPGKFFLLTTADQIITTFNAIGTGLTKLRIAQ